MCRPPRGRFPIARHRQRSGELRTRCDTTGLSPILPIMPYRGFVARIFLRPDYPLPQPLPQTDLAYGHGTRYAKSCEAVQDRGTDLDLRNLPIEVARREALTE